MPSKIWRNIPAGCTFEIITSSAGNYTAHADVDYEPAACAIPPGKCEIRKDQLDPGPPVPTIGIPAPGSLMVKVPITFQSGTEISVKVKAVIKKDGAVLKPVDEFTFEDEVKGTTASGAAIVDFIVAGAQ